MKTIHVAGLMLWRGGILLAGGYVLYLMLRFVLRIADPVLEIGTALVILGLLMVLASVIGERVADARREKSEGLWSE